MKDSRLTVQYNNKLAGGVYHMSLAGDCSEIKRPGQFIDILIDDFYLRRPISIFDHDDEHVEILYRVVGRGTDALAAKTPGDELDVLLPLGNGFDAGKCGKQNILVAGGIGMPPIHELAKQFMAAGCNTRGSSAGISTEAGAAQSDSADIKTEAGAEQSDTAETNGNLERAEFRVLLGFKSSQDMFGLDAFRSLGIEPVVATEDGSFGIKGLVTDVMEMMKSGAGAEGFDYDCVFCCGPEPMLKAVYETAAGSGVVSGQFSFEERMGCGFGACMGCSCETKYGYKRICRDGPILTMDEIVW